LRRANGLHALLFKNREKRAQQGIVAPKRCCHDSGQSERASRIELELGEFRPRHFSCERDFLAARVLEKLDSLAEFPKRDEAVGKWIHIGRPHHALQRHDEYGAAVILHRLGDGNGKFAATSDDSQRPARHSHGVHAISAAPASRPRTGMQMGRLLSARMN
jgi:hypothetical protein